MIEIDHPATQALKRHCIAAAGVTPPDPLQFLAADLATQDLPSVLRRSALRPAEPAFFDRPAAEMPDDMHALRSDVAAVGEPFVSGFDPATLAAEMRPLGYELLDERSDAELRQRYDPEDLNGFVARGRSRVADLRVTDAA